MFEGSNIKDLNPHWYHQ